MMLEALKQLFVRDLEKVKKELNLYKDESKIWVVDNNIKNSGGNLCLHLIGNLKTFIGDGLGKVAYRRDREFEFNGKGVSRAELLVGLDETIEVVEKGIASLTEADMTKDYPIQIWSKPTNMSFTIMHLQSHLNYHLGQLNYHRRLLDK